MQDINTVFGVIDILKHVINIFLTENLELDKNSISIEIIIFESETVCEVIKTC